MVLALRSWVRGRFHSGSLLRSRATGAIAATPAAKEHRKPRLFPSDAPRSLEIFNKLGDHTVRVRRATMRTVTTTEDRGVRYRDFRNLQDVIGGAALAYGLRCQITKRRLEPVSEAVRRFGLELKGRVPFGELRRAVPAASMKLRAFNCSRISRHTGRYHARFSPTNPYTVPTYLDCVAEPRWIR